MISIGRTNTLTALRHTSVGVFLGDDDGNDVLLPNKYVPETLREGNTLDVFVYTDSEDRLVATTLRPALERNEFGYLQVVAVTPIGAFLDWGLEKDLLLPFREQPQPLRVGQSVTVFLRLDEATHRLVATAKIARFFQTDRITLAVGQEVDVLVYERSDLGFNAILDNRYRGLIYANEVFQPLPLGSRVRGFVKAVRPDGGIDVALRKPGQPHHRLVEDAGEQVLRRLQEHDGFLPLNDRSEPALIYERLGMSKKTFKKTLGALYRERRVRLEPDGVYLV